MKDNLGPLDLAALGRFVAPLRVRHAPEDWDPEKIPTLLVEDANEMVRLELTYPDEEEAAFLRWAVGMWNEAARKDQDSEQERET